MSSALDTIVGNETYFLSCLLPFFSLFDMFFEVVLAHFDALLSWDSAGEKACLEIMLRVQVVGSDND